jgi:transcriptional regulator with XRE-family HTH domain
VKQLLEGWLDRNPLRLYRKAYGLSVFQAAAMLGVGASTVQKWEAGAAVPSRELAESVERVIPNFWERWREWKDAAPKWSEEEGSGA